MTLRYTFTLVLMRDPREWRLWEHQSWHDQWPRVDDWRCLCFFLRREVSVP